MKKSSFINGAFIATLAIFISKFLGIIYVIPFYHIIGEQNGSLYGYAYTIYNLFLSLSTIGLPSAMSKIVSEYNTIGYYYTKERAYKIGNTLVTVLGILSFIILFIFAPSIAKAIIGDNIGGNTIEDITFVVRIISTAILFVPILSMSKGYLQGHKYIAPSSFSQILEQVIRVTVILVGSYTFLNVFHLGITNAVGVAVFGATVGAVGALWYVLHKIKKNKKQLNRNAKISEEEKNISTKEIVKKIITYAIPFVLFGITISVYEFIDMLTIIKTLTNSLGYTIKDAESIIGVMNTWGNKLNSIVIAISVGLTTSLIPSITSSFVANKLGDVRKKINQSLQVLLYVALPITFGLSFLATPVFNAFYGVNTWGPIVFKYTIFIALANCLFNITVVMTQSINRYKTVFISLVCGILFKLIFNIPLMILTSKLGMQGFYGSITATLLGLGITIIINLISLKKYVKVDYKSTIQELSKMIIGLVIMFLVLLIIKFIIPLYNSSRIISILIVILYAAIGSIIYITFTYKTKVIDNIFGKNFINNLLIKFKIRQKNNNN
ncbi:MAG: polysaccharide biosynthesis protein [Firmicutes bacterium]|nr:polysaccharide biosynthesis protein [Bacillota bacterium]